MFKKDKDKILLLYLETGDGMSPERVTDDVSVGILSIGTYIQEKGYDVILAFDKYPDPKDLKWIINRERIKMVGFYTATDNILRVGELTKVIKENFPQVITVYGGPQATVRSMDMFRDTPVDIIVRYEGEYTFEEICNYYFEGTGKLEDIQGIYYRDGGDVKKNPDRPFIENLDELPILDRDLLPFKENYPAILTGRGCPYNCTFCFQGTGHDYRVRSVANVMEEVHYVLSRYSDPVYIGFMDDLFTADPQRTLALCSELKKIKEKRPGFHWYAEARANILADFPELIPAMKEAGLIAMQFGIESANKEMLKLYKKMITIEQVEKAIRKCAEYDIFQIVVSFILGGPFESKETIEEDLSFAKKLIKLAPGRVRILNGYLTPLPGTPLGDNPEKFGLKPVEPVLKIGAAGGRDYFCETENLKLYELVNLKQRFDIEVVETMKEVFPLIPRHQVERLFYMVSQGLTSIWFGILSGNTALKRYFNFKQHSIYKTFDELSSEEMEEYFPQRTDQMHELTSEGIILDRFDKKFHLSPFETRLFLLTSGRIRFNEIVKIISKEFPEFGEGTKKTVIEFYKKLHDIFGIVFVKL